MKLIPDIESQYGLKVFVYWNLHKNCWSVKALTGENKNRVVGHTLTLSLENCQFKVSEAGRQRVIREKKKNVHAGVVGFICPPMPSKLCQRVTYNPYKQKYFSVIGEEKFIHNCEYSFLFCKKVYAHKGVFTYGE